LLFIFEVKKMFKKFSNKKLCKMSQKYLLTKKITFSYAYNNISLFRKKLNAIQETSIKQA